MGLHARAASKIVHMASRFESDIIIIRKINANYDYTADLSWLMEKLKKNPNEPVVLSDLRAVSAIDIIGVMMLAASTGTVLSLCALGNDEEIAINAIENIISDKFGEGY